MDTIKGQFILRKPSRSVRGEGGRKNGPGEIARGFRAANDAFVAERNSTATTEQVKAGATGKVGTPGNFGAPGSFGLQSQAIPSPFKKGTKK